VAIVKSFRALTIPPGRATDWLVTNSADTELHEQVETAYWAALDEATSLADGEARLRRLVTDVGRSYPSAAACLAEDLPALCVHLEYPLRLRRRLRCTNLLGGRWRRSSGGRR